MKIGVARKNITRSIKIHLENIQYIVINAAVKLRSSFHCTVLIQRERSTHFLNDIDVFFCQIFFLFGLNFKPKTNLLIHFS